MNDYHEANMIVNNKTTIDWNIVGKHLTNELIMIDYHYMLVPSKNQMK